MALIINQTNSMVRYDITPIKLLYKNTKLYENFSKDEIINKVNIFCNNNKDNYIIIFIIGDADTDGNIFDINKEKYTLYDIFKYRKYSDTPLILITDLCVPDYYKVSQYYNKIANSTHINNT
ncbi:hypothetical protein CHBEV_029 [Choristoneura biennis entomopoxvirus]|uniref:Uncharacterized protein n=1 Tax=Choristoneura biennis entomopoxvirus TaxID=10288 RepID=A0A916KPG7_CBEPV|nr:hypothetical protein CHBEV_029 [Choristoneura biennis entomopoxvirus]CCU55597.1 hypothetical protein CHBEV_029 [Choristoneura biennis entomopoxvirus]